MEKHVSLAAIFDMDGLLIDSERSIMNAWLDVSREMGIPLAESDYLSVVGRCAAESDPILEVLMGGREAFQYAANLVRSRLTEGQSETTFSAKPGAEELVLRLHQWGIPCAVASSSSTDEIKHRLSAVGLLHYFSAISSGIEVSRGKPDPEIYELAASRLGVDAARCIAFEDSDHGATAAIAAGMKVVVVPDLKRPSAHVEANCFLVLDSLSDAISHSTSWFASTISAENSARFRET